MPRESSRAASTDGPFLSKLEGLLTGISPSIRTSAFAVLALSATACGDEGDDQNGTHINIYDSSTSTSTSGSQGSTHSSDSVGSSSADGSVSETHGGTTNVDTSDNTGGGVATTTDSDSGGMTTGVDTSMDKPGGVDIEGMDQEDVTYDLPMAYNANVFPETPDLSYAILWQNITANTDPIPCFGEAYSNVWQCQFNFTADQVNNEQETKFWAENEEGNKGPETVRVFVPRI